jgi:hypothetical protein
MNDAVETVLAWHAALNAGDIEQLVALSAVDVEVGGPRGSGSGVQLLRDWFARAGVRMEPGRVLADGDTVVVEQQAQWPGSAPQQVASQFVVRGGKVQRVLRFESLDDARRAAGL